ncbi:hypothetical protein [Acinetobacter gerneri]|jgi:hypothetical protein|uniref:hypothetical protein n=1 Tax=Acinetobacter gerneri TaxID=202952 RepID=UPI0023F37D0D|nr:hypothetical protein [Acinetobacter gerneri]MCH4244534.1 hypothetical protein [Acinetobacter gerneri]
MTGLDFELVENVGYREFHGELLKDYWNLNHLSRNKFTYTLNELIVKYKIQSVAKIQTIVKYSGHLKFTKMLDCGNCARDFKIYHRKDIDFHKSEWFKDQLICDLCKREKINTEVEEKITAFRDSIPLIEKYKVAPPIGELSYLEKIFLYVLITKTKITEDNLIDPQQWQAFQALEANGLEYLLKGIIDKGYIYISNMYDNVLIQQNELKNVNDNLFAYLSYDNQRQLKENLSLNFYNDIFLILPEKLNKKEDWVLKLFDQITAYELKIDDLKEIEEFLTLKRLGEVYALINYICRARNIPLKKNNAFEIDLIRMLRKYDLQHVWSIIFYQAKQAASELYDMEFNQHSKSRFSRDYVFPYHISSYLDYLESKNQNPKYPRKLPDNWVYSEIELFVSSSIIGHYQKWDKFTPKQIQAMWLESTKASDEDIWDIYKNNQ